MQTRLSQRLLQIAAFALVAVWLAGPLGNFAGAVLKPVHLHCHCPGHAHHEPAPPGPAFSPCDHDAAAANVAGDRWAPPAAAAGAVMTETVTALPQSSAPVPEGRLPLPESPPPKQTA